MEPQEQVVAWKKVTDAIRAEGGHIFCQLWHKGIRLSRVCSKCDCCAGGYPRKFRLCPGYATPTAIDDPSKLVQVFKQAAINAKAAGFDGVELHGAYGYQITQFLDSNTNHRTVANRARFGLECLQACVEKWGPNHVAIKLSPSGGGNDVGMPLDETLETFKYFITEAEKFNSAYICLMQWLPELDAEVDGKLRATQHDVLATYSPFITHTPIFLYGGVPPLPPEHASTLIASGKISAASFGRLWIGHPDLARRIENGKPLDADLDYKTVQGGGPRVSEEQLRKGYTDYKEAVYYAAVVV